MITVYPQKVAEEAINDLRQAVAETKQREWVGLTDEEHDSIKHNYHNLTWTLEMFARAIEQALKEKNHG
jgi:signal transduction histidine kinase